MNAVTAWSYSRYADYTQCPAKFKYKHLDRLPDPGTPAMQRGNTLHKLAEDFVKGKIDFPEELANFRTQFHELKDIMPMVEQAWGFRRDWSHNGKNDWFGKDVWLRSKADVFAVYEDDTADLIDHKSGRKYETNKDQVNLFALTGFMRIPTLKQVTTRLWYLDVEDKDENEVVMEYYAKDVPALQKDWEKRVRPMFNDAKFAPRPNDKCHWCPYSKAKGGPCQF